MRTKLGVLLSGLGLFCLALPLAAHHGFDTEYDREKTVKLTGVVSKVEWTNPHMRVYIDVKDQKGNTITYNMELTSPNTIRRRGWTMNTLLVGDKVIFEGYLGKVVESRGAMQKIVKAEAPDEVLFSQEGPSAESPQFPSARPGSPR